MADPMKIVVCGDSFCSAEKGSSRDHFSQILEDLYGYAVTNLARGGMSTVGIGFQIKQAIELRPDVIIYNSTSPDRVEIIQHDSFIIQRGLKNFAYPFTADVSNDSPYVGDANAPVLSTVWQGIDHLTTPEQRTAIELYLRHLFHWSLKYETDRWMLGYWHRRVEDAGIRPLMIDSKNFGFVYEFAKAYPKVNRLFHTDRRTQELAAEKIHAMLSSKKKKKKP